jgi:hypothetical protein
MTAPEAEKSTLRDMGGRRFSDVLSAACRPRLLFGSGLGGPNPEALVLHPQGGGVTSCAPTNFKGNQ